MRFVNALADARGGGGTPPRLHRPLQHVDVTLWTHAIGGLSENDFIVAAKLDRLPARARESRASPGPPRVRPRSAAE